MLNSALIASQRLLPEVYSNETLNQIRLHSNLLEPYIPSDDISSYWQTLKNAEVIFSTWGMPRLTADTLALMPKLKAVFYAAGAVKSFVTDESWKRGILISSAWRANAVPVAEFSLGAILLSLKQAWLYQRTPKSELDWSTRVKTQGAYHSTVGLVSLGAVGWRLVDLLQHFDLKVIAYDPFANTKKAAKAGVKMVGLEEVFSSSDVVSIHAPWLPETENIISGDLVRSMRKHATLINTARGAVINEAELTEALADRPDLTALLDVTYPEPPVPDSALLQLKNVILTPHIAGSIGKERQRMGHYMLKEYMRFIRGMPLQHQITKDAMIRMA